jgi:hypothetical protein
MAVMPLASKPSTLVWTSQLSEGKTRMTREEAKVFLEENRAKFVLAPVSHFEAILNDGAGLITKR